MKKISIIAALALLPVTSFAEESVQQNKLNPRFFIEYGISLYSNTSAEYELDGTKITEADSSAFNGNGSAYVGIDFDGIQIGIAPEFSETETEEIFGVSLRAIVPFLDGKTQPYISAELGFANMEYDDGSLSFDDTAVAYGIGAGVKYNFNDNLSIKGGLEYQIMNFETDVNGYEYTVDTSGFAITTSIGYRF
ncbi:MAG: porin family protein [Alphaproteobacteria bacterium]|nr:porin family protein [Alphaproteobacteria bacterium]